MDKDHIDELIELGSKTKSIERVQDIAAKAMERAGLGYTMHNACAATLSAFLDESGIDVPMTLGAGKLAMRLGGNDRGSRHWKRIRVGEQRAGDVGVTFDNTSPAGADHVYLVVERVDSDKMVIADNQAPKPHTRYASGRGRTATEYFLRAPDEDQRDERLTIAGIGDEDFYPWDDEDTNQLREPFEDDGTPSRKKTVSKKKDEIGEKRAPNYRSLVPDGFFSSNPFDRTKPVPIRCNNPGAINGATWEERSPGYVDTVETTPGNKTTIFEAPEYGVAVWWELLRRYAASGVTTVGGIINRYGGGQDYSNYIRFVERKTGFEEGHKIPLDDDATLLAFGKAMFQYEAGRPTPLNDDQIVYGLRLARTDDGAIS
ncbi:hypothetical protein OZ411_01530 [Bradyrhizobium sp. Arg237L]|uniref:hypothetical protein n=1 Tax=Bradyrhizobium sp. Arg237L TaxID=3003352 RepID=UPI00249EA536|nr:hypothetical protein [Bradyrhizobium sp. Arg237L]MDI4231494.1 hypothetical protein [Bradyrhizobium sp. Arg237L]